MCPHDMKYIGFKHQRENKQNSDNKKYQGITKYNIYSTGEGTRLLNKRIDSLWWS